MSNSYRPQRIDILGASAGTGKTFRLSQEFLNAVERTEDKSKQPLDPASIITTTFTNKAADELTERIRQSLISIGNWEAAQFVLTGYIGTVNSVCGRMLADFALEAGLSPDLEVIPEDSISAVFAVATDPIVQEYAQAIEQTAQRLSYESWRDDVRQLIFLARQNDISASSLSQMSEASWSGLRALLHPPRTGESHEALDAELRSAVERAVEEFDGITSDGTKTTADALVLLRDSHRHLRLEQPLTWEDWARLSKIRAGKGTDSFLKPVRDAANVHLRHPRLHDDVEILITNLYACAAAAMNEYDQFKRKRGLVDFIDQEILAFHLLDHDGVRSQLQDRLKLALVDEFQDTSPVQLALFLRISSLVPRSVWVGDEKQAIYGFRGADPELMQSVVNQVVDASGGKRENLHRSYRSRPSLIKFSNDLFGCAFPRVGIARERVLIQEFEREESSSQSSSLSLWWLAGTSWDEATVALASRISQLLSTSDPWLIADRDSGKLRPIIGSDIAVLCRSNDRCENLAQALAREGLSVSIPRSGLLDAAECVLAFATLRYLVDRNDTLALAEMVHLVSPSLGIKDGWLANWLSDRQSVLQQALPNLPLLDAARTRLAHLTPMESLELALSSGGVIEQVKKWGNAHHRITNLDALRGLAKDYEEVCRDQKRAGTAAGLVSYLFREVSNGGMLPANPDSQAVRVLTYHKAKGLEWPVVILADLHEPWGPTPFGLTVESSQDGLDPWNPLEGRWLRFWPWPYGKQRRGVQLDAAAATCSEMVAADRRNYAEGIRLLYVGMTRARDYLIFACRSQGSDTGWLDSLAKADGKPILSLPKNDGLHDVAVDSGQHMLRVENIALSDMPSNRSASAGLREQQTYTAPVSGVSPPLFPPYRMVPSMVPSQGVDSDKHYSVIKTVSLGTRLVLSGSPEMASVGEAVHRFLAADPISDSTEARLLIAANILSSWHVAELEPASLLEASNRLWKFLRAEYGDCPSFPECPVYGRIGIQRAAGRLDLLYETPAGYVIIDHKTFPGRFEQWESKALSFAPQLDHYATLVKQATNRSVHQTFIHMPIVGTMIQIGNSSTQPTVEIN